ncbi:hypothetical protein EC991775_2457 [Escherichia coli 99.1775]|nr:hypothetical protein EC991775_2457 [Escherichia coli 99.1775]
MNISSALRQVVHGTRWHAKRKSYKVLFWREMTRLLFDNGFSEHTVLQFS